MFSPPALLSRPSAGGGWAGRSGGSGIDNGGGGNRHSSEVLPLETSTLPPRSVGRETVAAEVPSSFVSTLPAPSLGDLVAAEAVARDAAAATTAAGARGDEAEVEGGGAEATADSVGDRTTPTTAVPSFPSDEIAPVSGSFPVGSALCSCCSHIDAVRDTSQTTENNGNVSSRSTATRLMEQHQRFPPSSATPVASSLAPLRRLPCGHNAHEACLIPLILESVGRGDPSRCLCPLDSSPFFPALSRHRRRVRRPRPGSDDGVSTAVAAAAAASHDHRRGTRSASSVAPPTASGGIDRHARAAAVRELLRRNTAAGFGGGGGVNAADALGIALFGSGLAQPPPPPPPSTRRHTTAIISEAGPRPRESGSTISTVSTRENGSMLRRAGVDRTTEKGENDRGGDGGGPRRRRNGGRDVGGGAGPRDGSLCGEPRLDGTALFVGGGGIVDATGGDSAAARAGRVGDGGGTAAARSRRRHRRRSACVVRGSTVGSRIGWRSSSSNGRDRNHNEACVSAVCAAAAGSVDGLALTTLSFAADGKGGAEESRNATGHPLSQEAGDEAGGRRSGRGRGRPARVVVVGNPSLVAGLAPATAGGGPPGHPSSVDGMALVTA